MLTIRDAQLQALGQQPREQFISEMLDHLYRYFAADAWLLTPAELRLQVIKTRERAAVYQLTSRQQVCRYINLAATYGWEFDGDPELRWMRAILTDASLAKPGERLDRLVQSCLHRQRIEEHNLALRQELGLLPVIAPILPEPEPAEDYAGHACYLNTVTDTPAAEELIVRNPLSYHLSVSLWHSLEAVPETVPGPAMPAWVNNTAALLRRKKGGRHVVGN